ncbi:3-oxoacyl-[acyl-carrier-protein] reductase FabG-like [Oppia nitens]|uniref:3-oxoacyl-[acyl-carrier-protein] reductase FabG-like n=1 Tax=Oppia nitens TaxID=1686743 RepID=UPI0023DC4EA9|nr:3-oxoacyl-[acyl-carrier-protein] reductase FabG-like [Oppia nitens]
MSLSYDFTGKVVLVTGSSSGIGATTVVLFAKAGANVVVTGRNAENVSQVAKQCEEISIKRLKPLQVVADVSQESECKKLLDLTIKTFGKLDVLVNNAGGGILSHIIDDNYISSYKSVFASNLDSIIYLTHYSVPYLEKTKGNIINISSIRSIQTNPKLSAYCMSKAAIDMFTKCMAAELGSKGIRVNSINPGPIRTGALVKAGLTQEQSDAIWDKHGELTAVGICGESHDIGHTVMFLASADSRFISGSICFVDGGWLANNANLSIE